jgi:hypothetical protein
MVDTSMGSIERLSYKWLKESPRRGVDEALARRWSDEASMNSSIVEGACKIRMFKRSTQVCNSEFQL